MCNLRQLHDTLAPSGLVSALQTVRGGPLPWLPPESVEWITSLECVVLALQQAAAAADAPTGERERERGREREGGRGRERGREGEGGKEGESEREGERQRQREKGSTPADVQGAGVAGQ